MRNALAFVWLTVVCLLPAQIVSSQQRATDDEAVKAVVEATTKAAWAGDFETWQSNWAHDPDVTRTLISSSECTIQKGWAEIATQMQKTMKDGSLGKVKQRSSNNFVVRSAGNMAAIEYDQIVVNEDGGPERKTREQRVLMKRDTGWKIVSQVTVLTGAFEDTPENLEASFNTNGYRLLAAGKVNEAIEVFKLNVQLFPKSWNAYDSLGEAYAKAGNKPLAIQNYEKSVQLNPKNEAGKAALAKLKGM
jgi:tetratricopeptide (TPR) repeat protein